MNIWWKLHLLGMDVNGVSSDDVNIIICIC